MKVLLRQSSFFFCLLFLINTGFSQGISITGTVEANTLSGTLSTSAMNSITAVGSLANLTVTGTIHGGTFSGTLGNSIVGIANLSAAGTPSSATYLRGDNTWATPGGSGTVTSVAVTSANGISGSVSNATSTPAITLSLGAIIPSSVVASGSITATGTISGNSIIKSGGTASQFLKADGSTDASTYLTSSGAVTSITGTANQITASAGTGAVTLSLPASISGLTTLSATNLTGTLTAAAQPNITALGGVSSITASGSVNVTGAITGGSFIKSGGTASEFLKADGSLDASTYLTSSGAVTSLTGTANEIDVSASTGSVTLSLPATVSGLTTLSATNLTGTLTAGSQNNITSLGGVTSITTTSTVSVPADNLLVGGNIIGNTVFAVAHLPGTQAATATNYSAFFIADRAYTIVGIRESHTALGTNGGTVTLGVSKLTSGQALGAGVTTMNGTFNLKGAINTPVSATLSATPANLDLAAGDRLELVDTGTLTAVAGVTVVVTLKAK